MTAPVGTVKALLHTGDAADRAMTHHVRTIAVCLVAVVLAFHYSLSTLVKTLQVDTPLAYLGLVPAISLVLIARRARRDTWEPPIHDRQVDYIVGVPLLLVALAINLLLPVRLSAMFWLWRIDLLALPLFASGAIVLLFGVRTLWRLRLPMLFLFLAWPLPYTAVILRQIELFTSTTLLGVRAGLHAMPGVARPLPGDGSLFQIQHGQEGFPVGVASACSGVNGLVGYALVGGAFLFELSGRWWRRALWLLTGLALVWVLNVARILGIFVAGRYWGQAFAIDALHPVLGLILFNVAVIAMLCLMGRFGLSFGAAGTSLATDAATATAAGAAGGGDPAGAAPLPPSPVRPPVVPRTRMAIAVVLVIGLCCGFANADLRSYDLVANLDGSPRLTAYQDRPGHPFGWRSRKIADFGWGRQFFGKDSDWARYDLAWDGISKTDFKTRTHVTVDVVSTTDASRFQTYGIEACYQFHGYRLRSQRTVDLGGLTARVLSWSSSTLDSTWTTVYWMWPVKSHLGTRYERVVMMLNDGADVRLAAQVPGAGAARSASLSITDRLGGSQQKAADKRVAKIQTFLISLAASTVARQPAAPTS
ncbi:exosortase/archaeosortase family protein [Aquihabitans sp. McL0605]|uniref:exosortase/archaeosortase family protein n=1 Tax=Aquihabitans sp. McL0605 TaxID=3415671 RepID=UPI003CF5CC7F